MKPHEINQQSDENLYAPFLDIKEYIQHPCEYLGGKEDNYSFIQRKQRVLPPLTEDEIDQLLKIHVTNQDNVVLQCSHSQECVSKTSSIIENENMSLNDDNHETDETIQEFFVRSLIISLSFLKICMGMKSV